MPSGLMKHIAWDPLVGAIVSNALPKATSKAAMLSLYSAVSGFATTPSHGAVEMCFCGNYPLTMAPTSGSHAMCFISPDGGNTAYMGNAGTHPVEGDAASLVCPPEYHDQSAADGVDCFTVPFHAGECEGAEDHGTHDHGTDPHPTSPPDHDDDGVIHVPWLAGFQDVATQSKTAHVGDSLHFMWENNSPAGHNVYMMASKAAFDSCDFTDATNLGAASAPASGRVEYKLTVLPAYFACEISGHCNAGQKLAVTAEM